MDSVRSKPVKTGNSNQMFAFLHIGIPLLILFIGIFISTQLFAEFQNYDSWLMPPLFHFGGRPVYAPWMLFAWSLKLDMNMFSDPRLITTLYPFVFSAFACLVVFFGMSLGRSMFTKNENLYGTARWATEKDLRLNGLFQPHGIVLAQTHDAKLSSDGSSGKVVLHQKKPGRVLRHSGQTSSIVIAPSRSGKGVGCIIPTLLSWAGSTIVFDPKAENYNITSGFRKSFSHILRFNPVSKDSVHYNPLMEIRMGDFAVRDAQVISDILISGQEKKSGGGGDSNEHFNARGKAFLTMAILHVLSAPHRKLKSIKGVLEFMSSVVNPLDPEGDYEPSEAIYHEMKGTDHGDAYLDAEITASADSMLGTPDRERGSIISTVRRPLDAIFVDPIICEVTNDSDFTLKDFAVCPRPISLYLTIPNSDVRRLAPLIRLLFTYFSMKFTEDETGAGNEALKHRTLLLLDEFPILGNFDFIVTQMGIMAGYGVTCLVIVQSLQQIIDIYGQNNPIMEHCKVWMVYAPGDLNTAETLSKIIGKETVVKESVSMSGSRFAGGLNNMNLSNNEIERNLINADEIMKLPHTDCLIFCHGMPPYRAKKCVFYDDPRFKTRVNIQTPKYRAAMKKYFPPRINNDLASWGNSLNRIAVANQPTGKTVVLDVPPEALHRASSTIPPEIDEIETSAMLNSVNDSDPSLRDPEWAQYAFVHDDSVPQINKNKGL